MADPNMTKNDSSNSSQTMQREQAKAEAGGGKNQNEQGGMDKNKPEKGAIGGQDKSRSGQFDKNRSEPRKDREPTGQR